MNLVVFCVAEKCVLNTDLEMQHFWNSLLLANSTKILFKVFFFSHLSTWNAVLNFSPEIGRKCNQKIEFLIFNSKEEDTNIFAYETDVLNPPYDFRIKSIIWKFFFIIKWLICQNIFTIINEFTCSWYHFWFVFY